MAFEGWGGGRRREGFGGFIRPDGGSCFLKLAVAIGLIATLGACAHTPPPEPQIRTVEVKVPVSVPCKATVATHKSYSDAAAETLTDIYDQTKALLAGRAERMADAERLKGAVTGCGGTVQ